MAGSGVFNGRTLLLTGATGAIGQAVAESFAQDGANLFLSDLNTIALDEARAAFINAGVAPKRIATKVADVANADSVAELVATCATTFDLIDFVVPMAGIYPTDTLAGMSLAAWKRTIDINLTGAFLLCSISHRHLTNGSAVVLVSSISAYRGSVAHAHYTTSKAGLLGLGRTMALEFAPKTRVNTVAPGIIETEMTRGLIADRGEQILQGTPLRRFGSAAEVARVIRFLCSDDASFITGQSIHVNGGLYMGA